MTATCWLHASATTVVCQLPGCCLQAPEPHSDSRAATSSVSWDLSNAALWEAVLDEYQSRQEHVVLAVVAEAPFRGVA